MYILERATGEAIAHAVIEFLNRCNTESRKCIEILALLPVIISETGNVQYAVDALMFLESDMPNVSSLRAELNEWPRYLRITEPTQSSSSPNLAECLEHADEDIFPNVRTLLRNGCTLPVGSCEAERSFPYLRRVKTYLRNRMVKDRLSGLTVMNTNHGTEIDLETACQMFIVRNKRKMFSSYIL